MDAVSKKKRWGHNYDCSIAKAAALYACQRPFAPLSGIRVRAVSMELRNYLPGFGARQATCLLRHAAIG